MTGEQFDKLVKQLEPYAEAQPLAYKFRVGLLAGLGYAYIVLVLLGLVGAIAVLAWITLASHQINALVVKAGLILLIPIFLILRSLWVTFPAPTGLELKRSQVPQLFDLIDTITTTLQCPPFHHILLTSEFNAAVVQIPRLGLLGWQQNYLILGLPLLQALSPQQFKAVLAHEFGHLSANHSKFHGWIYRVRKTWVQILESMQSDSSSVLFHQFFNWYIPYFNAYSFVLARQDEYEADRCAAQLAGSNHAAAALVNVAIKSSFVEKSFWDNVYKQASRQALPPAQPFSSLGTVLKTKLEYAPKWLEQCLAVKTDTADTHPCLSDRLQALGELMVLPEPITETAAQKFLGKAEAGLTAQLEKLWQDNIKEQWQQRHQYALELRSKLQALTQKTTALDISEAWDLAHWTMDLDGQEAAFPLLQAVLAMQADHVSANYLIGQILLERDDESGIAHMETAIAKDIDIVMEGCSLIYSFLQKRGREAEAIAYRRRAEAHYEQLLLAQQERSGASDRDKFLPHDLSAEVAAAFSSDLAKYPEIKEAYLVQKVVKHFPQRPYYVLGVRRQTGWLEWHSEGKDQELLHKLAAELRFPSEAWITILNGNTGGLAKALRKTAGVALYRK